MLKKIGLNRVFKNNIYMLKEIIKYSSVLLYAEILISVASAILGFLVYTYLLRYLINGYIEGKSFSNLIIIFLVIYIVYLLYYMFAQYYFHKIKPVAELELKKQLQKNIFRKIKDIDLYFYQNQEYYNKYVKAMSETNDRAKKVIESICNVFASIVLIITNVSLLIIIDKKLLLFIFIPILASYFIKKFRAKIMYDYNQKNNESLTKLNYYKRVFYLKNYAKELRFFNFHTLIIERYKKIVDEYIYNVHHYGVKIAIMNFVSNEINDIIVYLGTMTLVTYGVVIKNTVKLGDCLVVVNSIAIIAENIQSLVNNFVEFYSNSLYLDNYITFLDYKPKISNKVNAIEKCEFQNLKFVDIKFKYINSEKYVINNLNFTINKGEKVAIVGKNGAGKSTLIKLLLRLYDPEEGSIYFNNINIKDYKIEKYREIYAVVLQKTNIYAWTLRENILLCNNADTIDFDSVLENSGLINKVSSLEKGIESLMTKEFDTNGVILSQGENQKIGLARALVKNSEVVILDEPSSALDPIAESNMFCKILDLCEDKTVIYISHRLTAASLADRILIMSNGQIAEEGTHQDLMKKNGLYADMYRKQADYYLRKD